MNSHKQIMTIVSLLLFGCFTKDNPVVTQDSGHEEVKFELCLLDPTLVETGRHRDPLLPDSVTLRLLVPTLVETGGILVRVRCVNNSGSPIILQGWENFQLHGFFAFKLVDTGTNESAFAPPIPFCRNNVNVISPDVFRPEFSYRESVIGFVCEKPGTYRLQVSYMGVKSNWVELTVSQRKTHEKFMKGHYPDCPLPPSFPDIIEDGLPFPPWRS